MSNKSNMKIVQDFLNNLKDNGTEKPYNKFNKTKSAGR